MNPNIKGSFIRLAGSFLLLTLLGGSFTVSAEPKTSDGSAAIKKAQGMLRQLNQEKAALQAEKAELLKQTTEQDTQIKSLETSVKKLQPLQGEVERYKSSLENVRGSLETQLSEEKQRQQLLVQKNNEIVTKAKAIRDDNTLLVQAVQERERWIGECSHRNKDLQTAYNDMLSKYLDKGLWQQLVELDPLTGIGKVGTEAVIEEYRYKLQQLKVTPFQAPSAQTEEGQKSAADAEEAKR
jgi:chromosome segregation ATPase